MVDDHLEALHGEAHLLGGVADDALVGLVRREQGDVVGGQSGAGKRLLGAANHGGGGELEHRLAGHAHIGVAFRVGSGEARGIGGGGASSGGRAVGGEGHLAGGEGAVAPEGAVDVVGVFHVRGEDAGRIGSGGSGSSGSTGLRLVAPFQHHGPGAVAEQDARGALFPIDELAQALGGHDEHAAHVVAAHRRPGAGGFLAREGGAGHDEVGGGKPVDAAGAGAGHVVAHGVCGTDALADAGGLGGEVGVGGERRADDHVQAGGIDRSRLALPTALLKPQRPQRRLGAQVGAGLLDGDVAGVNARARDDPLVGGVYDFRELVVGDDARGQRSARSDDDAAQSRSFP